MPRSLLAPAPGVGSARARRRRRRQSGHGAPCRRLRTCATPARPSRDRDSTPGPMRGRARAA